MSGGYAVYTYGTFSVNTSFYSAENNRPAQNIYDTSATRTVISALGQKHVEQLRGIVVTNARVDDNLYTTTKPAVDGSGIQIPVAVAGQTANGIGTMLAYDLQTTPFMFITNSNLGLTSSLNANVNLLWTGSQYGERLDAGGATIVPSFSNMTLSVYTGTPKLLSSCTAAPMGPLCVNYPQTPPTGSVLISVTLNTAWTSLPSTYIADLLTAITQLVTVGNTYSSQSPYLGLYLLSCYPIRTTTSGSAPVLTFYLNKASVDAMGLNMSIVVAATYSALSAKTPLNTYLPTNEQNFITSVACPSTYNTIGTYPGLPCSSGSLSSTASSSLSSPTAASPSITSPSTAAPSGTASLSSDSSSSMSHGAIAGIVSFTSLISYHLYIHDNLLPST